MAKTTAKTLRGASAKSNSTTKTAKTSTAVKDIVLEIKGYASHNSARTQKEWYEYVVLNSTPAIAKLIKERRGERYQEINGKPVIVHWSDVPNGHGGLNTIARLTTVSKDGRTYVNIDVEMNSAKREFNHLMSLPKLNPSQKKRLEELSAEGNFVV